MTYNTETQNDYGSHMKIKLVITNDKNILNQQHNANPFVAWSYVGELITRVAREIICKKNSRYCVSNNKWKRMLLNEMKIVIVSLHNLNRIIVLQSTRGVPNT